MKKLFLFPVVLLLFSIGLHAQIGVSFGFVNYDTPGWNERIESNASFVGNSTSFDSNGFQYGIDYWFRLKQKRIEFMPEISFYQLNAFVESETHPDFGYSADMTASFFQLHFNTQIYPFDFAGDCDCPTFSKDGDVFKKGLFIRLAPGLSYGSYKEERAELTFAGSTTNTVKEIGVTPTLRAGVGLDIGVSDFITITPIIQYTHTLPTEGFSVLGTELNDDLVSSEVTQLYFGVRFGFRFDELNKYGYR